MAASPLYPSFLRLRDRDVLLVGGGQVANAKFSGLLAAGAHVTVVAPTISSEIRRESAGSSAVLCERAFQPSDLDSAWFVVAAATPAVNRQVADAANARRIFANVVDDPTLATAYAGGVLRRGELTVAISTGGAAPALAGLLREGLEAVIPADVESWLNTAQDLRQDQRQAGVPMSARRPALLAALNRLYGDRG